MATKKHNTKQRTRTTKKTSKSAVLVKSATKPNPALDAPKLHASRDPDLPILKAPQAEKAAAFEREDSQGRSAGQAGSLQGLSDLPGAAPESVDELLEEGNSFEAGIVEGVEDAPDADQGEVRTHEVPEDDVPEEYLDNEP
jgi:N utilization substance protein A